jgi:hypothetical protein
MEARQQRTDSVATREALYVSATAPLRRAPIALSELVELSFVHRLLRARPALLLLLRPRAQLPRRGRERARVV